MSGLNSLAAVTASAPVSAVLTSNETRRRVWESRARMFGSSSTTSTLAGRSMLQGLPEPVQSGLKAFIRLPARGRAA
jgi:hypothetical protein